MWYNRNMPTYDFKCLLDETHFEKNVPIDDRDGNIECPECGNYFVERLISFNGLTWAPTAGGMR